MVYIAYALLTGQGGRGLNEDWGRTAELPYGGLAAVVADGLGGQGGGEIASRAAGEAFLGYMGSKRNEEPSLDEAASEANAAVLACQTRDCRMMSTLVGLMIWGKTAQWVHIGDSRLYHFHNGVLGLRTLDHSVSQMAAAMGMIDESQIRFHEDRSRLLRALGSDPFEAEVSEPIPLNQGVHAFLLCSDGFWEYVVEEEMEAALAGCITPGQWLSRMEHFLKGRAHGNSDNYTAIAVFTIESAAGQAV